MKVKFRNPFKHPELYRVSQKAGRTEVIEIDSDTTIVEAPAKKKAAPKVKAKTEK